MSDDEITAPKPELLPEMEIVFDSPLEFGGKSVASIILREPRAREVQAAVAALGNVQTTESALKYNVTLISSVAGVSRQIVEQMPMRQFNSAAEYLAGFLG